MAAAMDSAAAPRIVLGSKSAGRKKCLDAANIAYEVMAADIDESAVTVAGSNIDQRRTAAPEQLTVAIAKAKAVALLPQLKQQDRLLITSGM